MMTSNSISNFQDINKQNFTATSVTIPVVVHILFHQPSENIPDSQVFKMIQVLNEDFGRKNPDTINTPSAFQSLAVNTGIQFCLAAIDTLGNSTTGIENVYTDTVQFSNPYRLSYITTGPGHSWNSSLYFNIWIGNSDFHGEGAYSWPIWDNSNNAYGLYCDYSYVNQIQLGDTSLISGRSITHAVGHCFNLFDTSDNIFCSDADSVSDTPNESSLAFGCPSFPSYDACTSTFPGIMFMNFMDYTDEPCRNIFTAGQAARMNNSLQFYIPQLLTSTACLSNGIHDEDLSNMISIYPIPAIDRLNIDVKKNISSIEIFSADGKKIQEDLNINNVFYQINISEWPSGIYFLRIEMGRENFFGKIVNCDH